MILTLNTVAFELVEGVYYSQPFRIEKLDTFMSIEVELSGNGSVDIDQSINGVNWFVTVDTTLSCAPSGLQTYSNFQPQLYFRLRSVTEFISANILI